MIGTLFADRYRVIERLGGGTFGTVYRAHDSHRDLVVALKVLHRGSPALAYHEARALTELESDNVLRLHDAGTWQDVPYLAMQVAELRSTKEQLDKQPSGIAPDIVRIWTRDALVGLGHCHERRLLHRDIKPSNIFLDRPDHALLGDFGEVRRLAADGTAPIGGDALVTAPEMFRDGCGTVASDVFSVGVTMYRLLSGQWPFNGADRGVLERVITSTEAPPLRDLAPHVSPALASVVHHALEREVSDRFGDWRAMHAALAPGTVVRDWREVEAHTDHYRCWQELLRRHGAAHSVCCIEEAGQYSIEVRRGSRRYGEQRKGIRSRDLPSRLRGVFKGL